MVGEWLKNGFVGGVPEEGDRRSKRFFEYWQSISPDGRLPSRTDFDPTDIPPLLPHLILLDVSPEPLRFRIRLMGEVVIRLREGNYTNRWMDEVYPDFVDTEAYDRLKFVVDEKRPLWCVGQPEYHSRKEFRLREYCAFPFSTDGENVDLIMSLLIIHA